MALLLALTVGCLKSASQLPSASPPLDSRPLPGFELEGKPFCFLGANHYALAHKPRQTVDDVLSTARELGVRVLRVWSFIDIGSLDGSRRSIDARWDQGKKDGAYFQYWDGRRQEPVVNEGEDGLKRLDYALARSAELGIKLILVLTNNWKDYGGMTQYLEWYGKAPHHLFYTDPAVRGAFKNWSSTLVQRRNSLTGRAYRDDPTIFAWELANEPRCTVEESGVEGWTLSTIPTWVHEMSEHIKAIDPNHMVAVGDEGFLNADRQHWTYQAYAGVDHEALTRIPSIDFGTFHMYPEHWGVDSGWDVQWILDHLRVAHRLGKPTVLEEYGIRLKRDEVGSVLDERRRLATTRKWNEVLLKHGGSASMVWTLLGSTGNAGVLDHDGYGITRSDRAAAELKTLAARFGSEARACEAAAVKSSRPASPFVQVPSARSDGEALGWHTPGD